MQKYQQGTNEREYNKIPSCEILLHRQILQRAWLIQVRYSINNSYSQVYVQVHMHAIRRYRFL